MTECKRSLLSCLTPGNQGYSKPLLHQCQLLQCNQENGLFFHYFLTPLCSMEHLFLWIDIQSRKGKRSYKLHSQDTKTSSKPYKLHGEIAAAIPNQALQRHRGEQLAGELERCGVVMSPRLGRMNFTSLVPLHSHCIQPQLLWLHASAGDWISPRESEIQINILLKNQSP